MSEFRKMCPFAPRMAFGSDVYDDDYGAEMRAAFPCVGKDCMAWRTSRVPADKGRGYCALIGRH